MRDARWRGRLFGMCAVLYAAPGAAQMDVPLFDLLCGRTVHVFYGPGNQIEYLAADGRSYFWNTGEDTVIVGRWRVGLTESGADGICFQYEPGELDPLDDGSEFCLDAAWFVERINPEGLLEGDRFQLMSGAAPFVLPGRPRLPTQGLAQNYPPTPRDPGCAVPIS